MDCKLHPYKIYKQDAPGEWYHPVCERYEGSSADEALNIFIGSRHPRCGDQSGNYVVVSLTCDSIIHFTVRPNQAYVIERD